MRQKYLRIKMDDGSEWEVAYEPLIRLAVARGIEQGAFDHMSQEEKAEHLRWCIKDVKEPSQVHDDLMDLSWGEVLSVGAQMVQEPTPPPYEQWWKETHSFFSFEAVYRDVEPETNRKDTDMKNDREIDLDEFSEENLLLAGLNDAKAQEKREFSYQEIRPDQLTATDLREEAGNVPDPERDCQAFHIVIEGKAEHAYALYIPGIGRIGIAWGTDATWADGSDVESAINMWLNEPDEWIKRN